MVAFIQQEAKEKAEEINVKAEEEFNIEKGRIVQQEKLKIRQTYERKEKQFETEKKIAYSTKLNASRLEILKARDEHLKAIADEARKRLAAISQDKAKYQGLLEDLLCQAFCSLLETDVTIRVRQEDIALVERSLSAAITKYKQITKKPALNATLDKEHFLTECSGGIEVSAFGGKIKCANTLDTRLTAAINQLLPTIRYNLFGPSHSRKFFE